MYTHISKKAFEMMHSKNSSDCGYCDEKEGFSYREALICSIKTPFVIKGIENDDLCLDIRESLDEHLREMDIDYLEDSIPFVIEESESNVTT